jgi:hypothetical protein
MSVDYKKSNHTYDLLFSLDVDYMFQKNMLPPCSGQKNISYLLFYPVNGVTMFFRNFGTNIPNYIIAQKAIFITSFPLLSGIHLTGAKH